MPTPSPAAFAWVVGGAAVPEPEPRYRLGGVTLPAPPTTTGGDLLPRCDPWLAEALPYFRSCLNRALGPALHAAMAGQIRVPPTQAACLETLPVDPVLLLAPRALKLPLLAGYPVSATFAERTLHHERMAVTYRLDYLLPPIGHEQAQRITPALQAAAGVLLQAIRRAGAASHEGGRPVWAVSGVEYVRAVSATFGALDGADLAQRLPALSLTVEVGLRTFDDDAAGLPFWGATLAAVLTDDAGDLTLATAETTLP
jgi:hypothetical protein